MFEQSTLGIVMKLQARKLKDEFLEMSMSGMMYRVYVDKNGNIDEESFSIRELTQKEEDDLNPNSPWKDKNV